MRFRAALVGLMLLAGCVGQDRDSTEAPSTTLSIGADKAVVLLDGWSRVSLASSTITAEYADGTNTRLSFSKVSEADLAQLLTRNPDAVAELAARTISADSAVNCDSQGCHDSAGPIPLSEIADPASNADLGAVYRAWNAGGLWAATMPRAKAAGGYRLSIAGQSSIAIRSTSPAPAPATSVVPAAVGTVTIPVGELDGRDETNPVTDPTAITSPAPQTGGVVTNDLIEHSVTAIEPNSDVVAVGVAFGHLFELRSLWRTESAPPFGERAGLLSSYAVDDPEAPPALPTLTGGLASYQPAAADLTASQLTAMSSPTTGCGIGVLCRPEAGGMETTSIAQSTHDICTGDGTRLRLWLRSETWALRGEKPWYQFSLGGDPAQGLFHLSSPPLVPVDGAELRVDIATVIQSVNRIVSVSGRTGVDEPLTLERFIETSGGLYSPC